jgi:hypothetical protein
MVNHNADVLLVSDTFECSLVHLLNGVYPGGKGFPFSYTEVESIEDAIAELGRNDCKRVISCMFPDDEMEWIPGVTTVDDIDQSMRVLDLLRYVDDHCPWTPVCIVSILIVIDEDLDSVYRSFGCTSEVLGSPFREEKDERLRKHIADRVLTPAITGIIKW